MHNIRYTLQKTITPKDVIYKVNNIVSSQAYYDYLLDSALVIDSHMVINSGDSVIDSCLISV